MLTLLAQSETSSNALIIGVVAVGLSALASLGVSVFTLIRMGSGRDAERQIEPTALHAISSELSAQTKTLGDINREVGEITTNVENLSAGLEKFREDMGRVEENTFKRINAISAESTATKTRVDGLERRETPKK